MQTEARIRFFFISSLHVHAFFCRLCRDRSREFSIKRFVRELSPTARDNNSGFLVEGIIERRECE
jgi:hypothetical protein